MPLKYLNNKRRFIARALRMVALPCLIVAMLAMSVESRPTRSPNPSVSKSVTTEQIRTAVRLATHQSPDAPRPLSVKLASATSRKLPPIQVIMPPKGDMAKFFPNPFRQKIVFSRARTLQFLDWMKKNPNTGSWGAGSASAIACGLIFAGTVIGAVPAALFCAGVVLFYWSNLQDAELQIKFLQQYYDAKDKNKPRAARRRACFFWTTYTVPMSGFQWYDFGAARCAR